MAIKHKTIDEYLSGVRDDQRAALVALRETIRAVAPDAEECISYQLAAFRQGGMLVAFGATTNHCAFYLMSATTVETHREELKDYDTSKGTIRFQPDQPLPAALVRTLVEARIAENETLAREPGKPRKPTGKPSEGPATTNSRSDCAVTSFLEVLDHPLKKEVELLRRVILETSPEIHEGIKWNSPSFRTGEYFATINLHARDRVRLILHLGAKAKAHTTETNQVPDPQGLLQKLGKDRYLVAFTENSEIEANKDALQALIREWVQRL